MKKLLLSFLLCFSVGFILSAQTKTILNEEHIDTKLEELRFNSKNL